jgi:hypothetical protein
MTEYLGFVGGLVERPYLPFVQRLRSAMQMTGTRRIVDLGSGGGGPLPLIVRLLAEREGYEVTAQLTDLHPNVERLERIAADSNGRLVVVTRSVDAAAVPADLEGFRLLCNSFHHMHPELARGILADAARKRQGIAVLEVLDRSLAGFAAVLIAPLLVLFVTPLIRPFRWSRLFFTYVAPLLPFFVLWDGLVSVLRLYRPDELRALLSGIPSDGYAWDTGLLSSGIPGGPKMIYLVGQPMPELPLAARA